MKLQCYMLILYVGEIFNLRRRSYTTKHEMHKTNRQNITTINKKRRQLPKHDAVLQVSGMPEILRMTYTGKHQNEHLYATYTDLRSNVGIHSFIHRNSML